MDKEDKILTINIINKNFGKTFYDLLENTSQELLIISPFISFKTADHLATWLNENDNNINCTIITRFNREEFIQGANSIEGLERLQAAGVKLYALQHLHTKLYIFDKKSVIMGSANFTFKGFFKNHELGMFIEDEPLFLNQCVNYFCKLHSDINESGDYKITQEIIQEEKKFVNSLLSKRKSSTTSYRNTKRFGAILDEKENEEQKTSDYNQTNNYDMLERYIEGNIENTLNSKTGIWIKFEGNSESRIPNNMVYLERKKALHEYENRTYYPRPPRSVQSGDTIFIAMVSKDKDGIETPMIVGYAVAHGFNENNTISIDDMNYKKWNNRYPYYLEFHSGKFLNQSISTGISLIELCNTLKHEVYPKTQSNPNIKLNSILKRHHQKAHLQITEAAKKYLINKLNKIFDVYGYDEI